jgi:hypothetical protein
MMNWRKAVLAFSGPLLLAAASLAILPPLFSDTSRRITRPLAEQVPETVTGWRVETLNVAESAEMRDRVERLLRYDDVVFRSYRRGASEVQIYAAYWRPGTVPYGQAGVHTPDTCWVNAGWSMDAKVNAREFRCGNQLMKPSEWRVFSHGGHPLYVLFWHLVGEDVHTYEQYGWRDGVGGVIDRLPNFFRDVRRYGLNLAREQMFLRISSNVPFETLFEDPAFVALLETLKPLQIFRAN